MNIVAMWLIGLPIAQAWRGFVLARLWTWFIVPLGPSALSTSSAVGIAAMVSLLTYKGMSKEEAEKADFWHSFFDSLAYNAIALLIGSIAHIGGPVP